MRRNRDDRPRTPKPADVFQPIAAGDDLRSLSLYADGHAVASYTRTLRDVGYQTIRYYVQIDSIGIDCRFAGRLIFNSYQGLAWLRCMLDVGARSVWAKVASLDEGSEKARKLGIAVGYVTFETPHGTVSMQTIPGLINPPVDYYPDEVQTFNPGAEDFGDWREKCARTILTRTVEASTALAVRQ